MTKKQSHKIIDCWLVILFVGTTYLYVTLNRQWVHGKYGKERSEPADSSRRLDGIDDTGPSNEPSYIRLCRSYLSRSPIMVDETFSTVCHDNESPFWAVSTVLASSLISQAGREQRLGITYQHGCEKDTSEIPDSANQNYWENRLDYIRNANVQQYLPKEITFSANIGVIIDTVESNCRNWLDMLRDGSQQNISPESLIFGAIESVTKDALQIIGSTLTKSTQQFHRRTIEAIGVQQSTFEEELDGAIIMLGSEGALIPIYMYAAHIPPSVTRISILSVPSCAAEMDGCIVHGNILKDSLANIYPRAEVTFEIVQSSLGAYTRMMRSKHLVCPVGHSCLLPALFRKKSTFSVIMENMTMYPWFSQLVKYSSSTIDLVPFIGFDSKQIGIDSDKVKPFQKELEEFLFQTPPKERLNLCKKLRGRFGHWLEDMNHASKAQYITPLRQFQEISFEPTDLHLFPPATTYRWEEGVFRSCQINLVERESLCHTLGDLNIKRIFFVGDSLSLQMAQSFWKLMSFENEPSPVKPDPRWKPWSRFDWTRDVECKSSAFTFYVSFIRNDFLNDNMNPVTFQKVGENSNCGKSEYCFPWIEKYKSFPDRSLVLANLGSHVHSVVEFKELFDNFMGTLERNMNDSNDIIMFRTTSPGHNGCQTVVEPFVTHSQYTQTLTADFRSWHKFGSYNDYVYRKVQDYSGDLNNIHILDIYPMTILRPDGHLAGPVTCKRCKKDDCLHYTLPGPGDWWSHLMFTYLQDLAAEVPMLK